MGNIQCDNWQMVKDRFEAWWNNDCIKRPMLSITARREKPLGELIPTSEPTDAEDLHMNVERRIAHMKNHLMRTRFMAESYPNGCLDIGPGSLAVYLGSPPIFAMDTIWYGANVADPRDFNVKFDPDEPWFVRHIDAIRRLQEASNGEYLVNIPDIIEGMDIYSAMRGPQPSCYDLIDEPELAEAALNKIDEAYFEAYDRFHEIVRHPDNVQSFTAFQVMGYGRIAKVQCDFNALMSPKQFRRFSQPALRAQCAKLDHSVFHLDGPDAIKHVDALMEIDELDALQWTCGAGQPDSRSPRWYPIYDRVKDAKKALHLGIYEGKFDDWICACDSLVDRYGVKGMYFLLPQMSEEEGEKFIEYADKNWTV